MKRISWIIICLLIVTGMMLLSACSDREQTDLPQAELTVLADWQSFTIMRPDMSSSEETASAVALRSAVKEATGVQLALETDWVKRGESVPTGTAEILIGSTNRPESENELLYRDWEIEFVGGRLAIRGGSGEALAEATDWFVKNCVGKDGIRYPISRYTVSRDYAWKNVTIDGVKLGEYAIDCEDASIKAELKSKIAEATGLMPPDKADNQIIVAHSDSIDRFAAVVTSGKKTITAATNMLELQEAYQLFMEVIENRSGDTLENLNSSKIIEVADFGAGAAKLAEVNEQADGRIAEIRAAKSDYKVGNGGTVYYISNKGDNMNDGKSAASPKATPDGLPTLKAGDVVLFERGGLWRDYFKTVSGVTYSAYGEGEKPRFYASPENGADESKWKLVEGTTNIWVYATEMMDVGNIIFNDGELYGYKSVPYYRDGKYWVNNGTETEYDFKKELTQDLMFFSKADSKFSGNTVPVSDTDNVGEIYLRCDKGNPGKLYQSIEFLIRRNGIGLVGDNVIIDNFCIKYVGAHGIGGGTVGNVTIRNCEIGWIGGGVQYYTPSENKVVRYGNGIEIYGGCDSYTIENCYVYDCYDAGITHQYQKGGTNAITESNVTYRNNVIERCAYNIEYFMGAVESGTASRVMKNILITGNILRDAGKSFGARAHSVHIMGWGHRNEAYNFVIENNIFSDAQNRIFYIGASDETWLPTFRGNTYIQKFGGRFAYYGVNGKMAESSYTKDFEKKIAGIIGETDAKVYYILGE